MNVTQVINRGWNPAVMANVDGNYDKGGLPKPPVLPFYFSIQGALIVQPIIAIMPAGSLSNSRGLFGTGVRACGLRKHCLHDL